MENLKAVLFDLDGTLIDSEHFYYSNWRPILADSFQLDISFEDWITYFAGHTLSRNVVLLREKWGIETDDEYMWARTRANYAQADMRTIGLMPYAEELLDQLLSAQIRIGLVTSSYDSTVQQVLGAHQLLRYFEFFVTRDQVQRPKPDGEPYLLALSRLQLPAESVVAIEDTTTGVHAAQAADLAVIAVSKHAAERRKFAEHQLLVEDLQQVAALLLPTD